MSNPLILVAVAISFIYIAYQRLLCRALPGIPHNRDAANTLLGDLPKLLQATKENKPIFDFIAAHPRQLNSPVVQFFLMPFSRPWVIVADFRETQDILLRRTKEFDRSEATTKLFSTVAPDFHMCWKSDTEKFKMNRNLLKDLMTPAFLNQVAAPQVHASVSNLLNLWSFKAKLAEQRAFDAFQDVFDIMLDSITGVTFGLDVQESITASRVKYMKGLIGANPVIDDQGNATFKMPPRPVTYEALDYSITVLHDVMRSPLPRLAIWLKKKTPSYRKAYNIKENMITEELEKGLARATKGDTTERCALDNMLQREVLAAGKAKRSVDYHTRSMYDELLGFLLGGHETTASTMTWGYKYIAANPQVQSTLRSHLRSAFPAAIAEHRLPSAEEITKAHIPYLEATVEEIHRFAHVFSMVVRRAQVDTSILGYAIPKGTDVAFTTTGPSFDSAAFPISDDQRSDSSRTAKYNHGSFDPVDGHVFKPERWLKVDEKGEEVFDATAGPLLAFSLGPRGCYGRRLAYLQVKILLILVLWKFELLEVDGELGSFAEVERLARVPKYCYLRLKELEL